MAQNVDNNADKNPMDNLVAYYENNKKRINTIGGAILVVIIGIFAYLKVYQAPRIEKAATALAYPQRMMEVDSFDLALNGDGQNQGFLSVKRKYSGTPSANLCNYYIGACYLKKGEFDNAIKYLKDFDGKGTLLGYVAYGALGDAYMEKGNTKDGVEYYMKAAGNEKDDVISPMYLYRAGVAYEMNNQPDKAKDAYKKIRDKYAMSSQAQEIDRHLARLGVLD
jgi:tetratricopeptide (TPR) repeat protein